MAVQAQYPSNILLLNRNAPEINDCSLQHQPGGFLDQSHILFTTGATSTNQRKRGRPEAVSTAFASMNANNHLYSLQPQPPQLIDLTQLHNNNNNNHHHHHQSNLVSTGLHLSFGEHHHHNHHQQQQQQQQQQNHLFSNSSASLPLSSEDFATQFKQQRDEIDQFLHAQGEQLRRTLAEKRQRHYRALLGIAEESVARKLREKDAEMEKATRRYGELEARAAQLSVEAQVWQAKARAQEAAAASLQAQLQQLIMSGQDRRAAAADDGGGGPGSAAEGQAAEDAESAYVDPDRVVVSGPSCKACSNRAASVVLLPCRHLCVCPECDTVVHACPVCFATRNSSVEVYLS
ncbi:E3 ubiquitin-protein ligase BOI [Rhodamnia argentea]|uniref:E3 ubiquitin-protein ligase BOI n=1 Tax=Rhodamnia argentea TaxID=178133 RepID=A0A8B8NRJ9_9MYRT|nr:E3 ubiquitin-protein ligase BOI [Rhodamnia argentea]